MVVAPMTSCGETHSAQFAGEDAVVKNFVDERFEFMGLVFRLAGFPYVSEIRSNYHRRLDSTFSCFRGHETISAISNFENFASFISFASILEITDDGFALRDWDSYRSDMQLHFDRNWLLSFVNKLNDLHRESNFRDFFNNDENQRHFMRLSTDFVQNVYRNINFEWFEQFGLESGNMHVILTPSLTNWAFAQTIYDEDFNLKIAYAVLGSENRNLTTTIHEFAHSFGDTMAAQWFSSCLDFWSLTRETLQRGSVHSIYATSRMVANDYVARALTILYMLDNTNQRLASMLQRERNRGFGNIEEVFDMLARYLGRYELIQS